MHQLAVREIVSSILDLNCVIVKDVKSCSYCCYVRCATLIVMEMPLANTCTTYYRLQLGLPDKCHTIIGLLQWLGSGAFWPIKQFGPIGCYQPSTFELMYVNNELFNLHKISSLSLIQHIFSRKISSILEQQTDE